MRRALWAKRCPCECAARVLTVCCQWAWHRAWAARVAAQRSAVVAGMLRTTQAEQRSAFGGEQAKLAQVQVSVELAKASLSRVANDLAAQQVANRAASEQLEQKR